MKSFIHMGGHEGWGGAGGGDRKELVMVLHRASMLKPALALTGGVTLCNPHSLHCHHCCPTREVGGRFPPSQDWFAV